MTTSDSPPLDTIGSYDLLEKVGEGSMGRVYRARHWQSKEIVALKVMHTEVARNPVLLKRFEQEFRTTSRLDHPNVVRMLEFCGTGTSPYMVMEFIDGESLMDRLERDGKLPEDEAVKFIVQVAHGLHRAHKQGLIHRDIKPDNIMVNREGQAKLLDLGLAKDAESGAELTRAGQGLGTPDFMAPEQFRNAKNASVRCDIYSMGASLYMMVTGRYPFDEADPLRTLMRKMKNELPPARQLVPELSERTNAAIQRAMSAAPDDRQASCREFAEELLGQSTREPPPDSLNGGAELWYVIYPDQDGMVRTFKGTADAILQSVRDGRLGQLQAIRGGRSATGPFQPLTTYPEFGGAAVSPTGPPEGSAIKPPRLAVPPARIEPTADPSRPLVTARPDPLASPTPSENHLLQSESAPPANRWLEVAKMVILVVAIAGGTLLAAKYLNLFR